MWDFFKFIFSDYNGAENIAMLCIGAGLMGLSIYILRRILRGLISLLDWIGIHHKGVLTLACIAAIIIGLFLL